MTLFVQSAESCMVLWKSRKIAISKQENKIDLFVQLGKNLFWKKDSRIDENDVVKYNNLMFNDVRKLLPSGQ